MTRAASALPDIRPPGGRRALPPEAVRRHLQAEAALRGERVAARARKVVTRECAKDGSHAALVLPDAHHPHADPACMAIAERVAGLVRPRRIVILGDWLECAAFTAHPPRSIAEEALHAYSVEIDQCAASIDRIVAAAGGIGPGAVEEVAYIEGNHEAHVERECIRLGAIGRAVHDMISPRRLLSRGRPWLKWTPYVEHYAQDRRPPAHLRGGGMPHYKIASDLWAIHGWTTATHAAAKHLQMAGTVSIVHGHTHRQQSVTGRCLETGRLVKAWSPGCLSDLQPAWHHTSPSQWAHGISVVYLEDKCRQVRHPKWTDYTITIDRGECVLPAGTSVRA